MDIERAAIPLVYLKNKRQLWLSFAVLMGLAILLVLFLFDPAQSAFFPPCPFHKLTGLDCPGCGSTRGLHALLHGHAMRAVDFNPLLLPGLAAICANAWHSWSDSAHAARLWAFFNRPRLVLWIVCAFWVLRNIPAYPFRLLNSGY